MTESNELIVLEDVASIIVRSHDLTQTLDSIVNLLAERMAVEVCSIYLADGNYMMLRATKGLDGKAVGKVRMSPEDGLTGLTFRTAKTVNVERADTHPNFKYFPDIGEENVSSFLGVPLIHRKKPIGVLCVQTAERRVFTMNEERMLVAAAGQLAGVIAIAQAMDDSIRSVSAVLGKKHVKSVVRGTGASGGFSAGRLVVLADQMDLEAMVGTSSGTVEEELFRFDQSLGMAIADLATTGERIVRTLGEEDGAIFHAHLMMLEDSTMQSKVREKIESGLSALQSMVEVAHGYIDIFLAMEDPYLRERAGDVRDVAQRVVTHLRSDEPAHELTFDEPVIVLAADLMPSQIAQLLQSSMVGLALTQGGRNSHTVILCRAAGIPVVLGAEIDLHSLDSGMEVILDGNSGLLYLTPSADVRAEYERLSADDNDRQRELAIHSSEPPITRDGRRITLMGNAALVSDLERIKKSGAEGIGLYRTEFPFLIRQSFPTEQEQYEIYARVVSEMDGKPVTFRTLDIGGDKPLPYMQTPIEENPQLGWRSIRISFDMEDAFREQIIALLRAGDNGNVRLLFPMISDPGEMEAARRVVEQERERLGAARVDIGAMIEVPSAALMVGRLARVCDFFSVGTNDLAQYLLAVDRGNPKVAHLYDPLHPSVLTVLDHIVQTAKETGKPLGVCGELAGRGLGVAALISLGVEELSINSGALLKVRRLVQCVESAGLEALRSKLLEADTGGQVVRYLSEELKRQRIDKFLW